MAGPLTWWANRKSQMGLRPLARKPPHLPTGKEWWTTPPTTCPQPEFIEYASNYMAELIASPNGRNRQALIKYVADWLGAARRLLHEEQGKFGKYRDLETTDGLFVAASTAFHKLGSMLHKAGIEIDDDTRAVMNAVGGRADRVRRARAIESAKRRQ